MNIDEAIRHCEEVAAKHERQCEFGISKEGKEYNSECAADHRQLADWLKELKELKAADVPVKHGYWIKQPEKFQIYEDVINSNYLYSCSCCNASDLHSERANNDGEVKFCWRCGARMDGDVE